MRAADLLELAGLEVDEAANALGCRRRQVFQLLAEGRLRRAASFGRRTRITFESVRALLEACPEEAAPKRRRAKRPRASLAAGLDAVVARVRARPMGRRPIPDSSTSENAKAAPDERPSAS